MLKIWIRLKVPIDALERAIEALKVRSMQRHYSAANAKDAATERVLRGEGDADDQAAEEIKQAIREEGEP